MEITRDTCPPSQRRAKPKQWCCPEYLSVGAEVLWKTLVPKRIRTPEQIALLVAGLESRDLAENARELLEAYGGDPDGRGIAVIRLESLRTFATIWSALGLDKDVSDGTNTPAHSSSTPTP